MNQLDKIKNRLKNLKQNKNLSEEEIEIKAKERLEKLDILNSLTFCLEDEKEYAIDLLSKYLEESSLESTSEKNTLTHLIDLEVLLNRIKKQLNLEYGKANPAIPIAFIQQVTELTNQILELKEKLGLTSNKSNDSVFQLWEDLKEKCLKYYEEHAAEFQNKCPYCNKLFPSILPPEKLIPQISSWFKGTDLYNEEVFNLYHNKIITEEQAAKILGVSNFYVPYIYQEIYLKLKNDK
jgi:hypothetical protein